MATPVPRLIATWAQGRPPQSWSSDRLSAGPGFWREVDMENSALFNYMTGYKHPQHEGHDFGSHMDGYTAQAWLRQDQDWVFNGSGQANAGQVGPTED